MATDPPDTPLAAAEQILDRLTGGDAPSQIIREGGALLVRRGDVLARVRVDDGWPPDRSPSTGDRGGGDGARDRGLPGDGDGARDRGLPAEPAGAPGRESKAWRVSRREVAVARALAEAGIPATRLVEPDGQPWSIGRHIVSAWRWIDPPTGPETGHPDVGGAGSGGPETESPDASRSKTGGPEAETADAGDTDASLPDAGGPSGRIDPASLGALARRLREHGPRDLDHLPALDPFEAIDAAVGECAPDDPEACFVRDRAQELRTPWIEACRSDPLGRSLVHGDLHADNVILGADGPVLTDFELSGVGGAGFDAAPAAVAVARYGAPPESLERFIDGFGADPRVWSGFAVYTAVYELWTTAWAVGVRAQNPRWAAEADRRVATLRDGADHRWELN